MGRLKRSVGNAQAGPRAGSIFNPQIASFSCSALFALVAKPSRAGSFATIATEGQGNFPAVFYPARVALFGSKKMAARSIKQTSFEGTCLDPPADPETAKWAQDHGLQFRNLTELVATETFLMAAMNRSFGGLPSQSFEGHRTAALVYCTFCLIGLFATDRMITRPCEDSVEPWIYGSGMETPEVFLSYRSRRAPAFRRRSSLLPECLKGTLSRSGSASMMSMAHATRVEQKRPGLRGWCQLDPGERREVL